MNEPPHGGYWQRKHDAGCANALLGTPCDCPPARLYVAYDVVIDTIEQVLVHSLQQRATSNPIRPGTNAPSVHEIAVRIANSLLT